jgi:hypothetical protein
MAKESARRPHRADVSFARPLARNGWPGTTDVSWLRMHPGHEQTENESGNDHPEACLERTFSPRDPHAASAIRAWAAVDSRCGRKLGQRLASSSRWMLTMRHFRLCVSTKRLGAIPCPRGSNPSAASPEARPKRWAVRPMEFRSKLVFSSVWLAAPVRVSPGERCLRPRCGLPTAG